MGSEHLFKYPFYMMNWLWCWLYPCDGAQHVFIYSRWPPSGMEMISNDTGTTRFVQQRQSHYPFTDEGSCEIHKRRDWYWPQRVANWIQRTSLGKERHKKRIAQEIFGCQASWSTSAGERVHATLVHITSWWEVKSWWGCGSICCVSHIVLSKCHWIE